MLLVAAAICKYIFVSVYSLAKQTLSQTEPDFTLKILQQFPLWVLLVLATFLPRVLILDNMPERPWPQHMDSNDRNTTIKWLTCQIMLES